LRVHALLARQTYDMVAPEAVQHVIRPRRGDALQRKGRPLRELLAEEPADDDVVHRDLVLM